MDERFSRSARIFGTENQEKLNNAKVLVFGLGGVGGAVCEALARSGVGTIGLVDKDTVDIQISIVSLLQPKAQLE
jgi:tRNA A37 threonylcarbamoyladenosine dehydratase